MTDKTIKPEVVGDITRPEPEIELPELPYAITNLQAIALYARQVMQIDADADISELPEYKIEINNAEDNKNAKSLRAYLNKIKKGGDEIRKEAREHYIKPYNKVRDEQAKLDEVVDYALKPVSSAIKEYEDKGKAYVRAELKAYYEELAPDIALPNKELGESQALVPFERIENPRWQNKTFGFTKAKDEIEEILQGISKDVQTIKDLSLSDDDEFNVLRLYYDTLDLSNALSEANRIKKQREQIEARKRDKEVLDELYKSNSIDGVDAGNINNKQEQTQYKKQQTEQPRTKWILIFEGTQEDAVNVGATIKKLGIKGTIKPQRNGDK